MNASGESGGTMSSDDYSESCTSSEEDTGANLPSWEAAAASLTLGFLVLATVLGERLSDTVSVHIPAITYSPKFFIVSLAVADLAVAILVMPFNVAYLLLGKWIFGIHLCKLWLTCDVLCCTASILNLCAIALDRYWAITDPINYAQKRTLKRVLATIAGVWILSGAISSPPLAGWNDWPEEIEPGTPCQLTQRQGYVIYSSLGSFFIPLLLMSLVYLEIFLATRRRLRERARQSRFGVVSSTKNKGGAGPGGSGPGGTGGRDNAGGSHDPDDAEESVSSETNHNERTVTTRVHGKPSLVVVEDDAATEVTLNMTPCRSGKRDKHPAATVTTANVNATTTTTTVYQFIEERQRISLSKGKTRCAHFRGYNGCFCCVLVTLFSYVRHCSFCPACCPSERMVYFITWLGYINSALNPLIYTIFNLDYRRAFRRLLHLG